jgi:hypothetical protein
MATFGLLALAFGPFIALFGWIFKMDSGSKPQQRRGISSGRLTTRDIAKNKRAQAIKDWMEQERQMRKKRKDDWSNSIL